MENVAETKQKLDNAVEQVKEARNKVNEAVEQHDANVEDNAEAVEEIKEKLTDLNETVEQVTSKEALADLIKEHQELNQELEVNEKLSQTVKAKGIAQVSDAVEELHKVLKQAQDSYRTCETEVIRNTSINTVKADQEYLQGHANTVNFAESWVKSLLLDFKIIDETARNFKGYHLNKRALFTNLKDLYAEFVLSDHKVFI